MTADRGLLATVAEGLGGDPDEPDGAWDVAELAIRDTGRWLADRLRENADLIPEVPESAYARNAITSAAHYVARWCGVPEGAGGGEGG